MQGHATRPVPQLLQVSKASLFAAVCLSVCGGKDVQWPQLGCFLTCHIDWNA